MERIFELEYQRLKALKKRLEDARAGEIIRKKYATILNKHFKTNGYGHHLFKTMNVAEPKNSNGEKDGKSK
tara:strand:+ start:3616 stop:3828 length:213 start_codon:yes stop_codon:yes gene_type:complete